MFDYSSQLILSISIRIIAALFSIYLIKRIRDWRIAMLTLMLLLMDFQQVLRFFEVKSEIPGFVVSILALLTTILVGRLLLV
ncbi:MAG: hypothetical protein GXY14_15575 [Spirochaetes bacterium]|nr:hypothetical protein [Spirochaetota bacterium]